LRTKSKHGCTWALVFGAVVAALAAGVMPGWGQAPLTRALLNEGRPESSTTNAGTVSTLAEKLAKAQADLAAVPMLDTAGATNGADGIAYQEIVMRRGMLERLVRLYEQQMSFAAELANARNRRLDLEREAQTWTGFAEPRPYSILLTDSLHEGIQLERQEMANAESSLAMLTQLADEQRETLKQAEEKIRQIDEQMERGKNAQGTRDLERVRSQVSAASLSFLEQERQLWQERMGASRIRMNLLQRQLVFAKAGVVFSEADVERINARLDVEQRQLERELAEAQLRHRNTTQAVDTARQTLTRTQAQAGARAGLLEREAEQLEVRRAQLETSEATVDALRFMLQIGAIERAIWEARFAAYRSSSSVAVLRHASQRLGHYHRRVVLWQSHFRRQLDSVANQVALLETRLLDASPAADLAPLLRERLAALRERDQNLLRVVRRLERGDRLLQRLEEGLNEAAQNLPMLSRVRNAFSDSGSFLSHLWNLELFVAQDTITVDGQAITGKRSITLGKIISAILILVVGFWLTGLLARVLEPLFIKRFKIESNQANLIRRWLRVALVFSLTLFSLVSVKIPLTIFAFAGGALAIGLGFGLQTMLKNFVSGIIILFERPFRVGDVLDVAGQRGTVSSIGIRSSVLQLWDGTETLIPNSALLENNLTNWTYSTRLVRFNVQVGVAYGSDTRRVIQLLGEIAERHGLVEKEPKPQVLFTNFAESALEFDLRFWVDVVKANSAQVASDLRQMIASTFAENGIVIAFPQRELHLSATQPLEVRVKPFAEPPPQKGKGEGALPLPDLNNANARELKRETNPNPNPNPNPNRPTGESSVGN